MDLILESDSGACSSEDDISAESDTDTDSDTGNTTDTNFTVDCWYKLSYCTCSPQVYRWPSLLQQTEPPKKPYM